MKINDIKHNHSLTDLLKVMLFSILMLAPFCSVAVRSLYVICNKNAYQSYSNEIVETTINYNATNQLYEGIQINVYKHSENGTTSSYLYQFSQINLDLESLTGSTASFNAINFLNDRRIQVRTYDFTNNTGTNLFTIANTTSTDIVSFITNGQYFVSGGSQIVSNAFDFKTNTFTTSKLDNVFEYSVSRLADDQLFNWTQQTAVFSPVESMCTNLGITNQVIPQILVYWFLLSVIYVIIDIILKSFTALTHMLGSKKA